MSRRFRRAEVAAPVEDDAPGHARLRVGPDFDGFRPLDRSPVNVLALENELPGPPAEAFPPHLKAEARRVWELQQSGELREIYFKANRHTAVILLECSDIEAARRLLGTLPLVQAGLITFDVIPLVPYDGFARLFA